MTYKLMVIDDARSIREKQYEKIFTDSEFEITYIWSRQDFMKYKEKPVDGYLIDVFLDKGDWHGTTAADLLTKEIQNAPRPAPVFLVSQKWRDEKVLDVLKQAGESTVKVVQYLAWSEFEQAVVDDKTSKTIEEEEAARNRLQALRRKLLFELDRWHGRSGYSPEPDDPIRILLLSDVQFKDPKTDKSATFAEHWIVHSLRQDKCLPDLIVIAGDVSHSGRPDQFALAEERIVQDLMGRLWGKNNVDRFRDRLIIVPGNHDVNLRFSACDKLKFNVEEKKFEEESIELANEDDLAKKEFRTYRYHHDYALEPFRRFAHKLTNDRNLIDSPGLSWVDRRFLHCGIRFFVLNSVAELNADNPKRASFSESDVRNILRSIDDHPDEVFSIAVSHHGLRPEGTHTEEGVANWDAVGCDLFAQMGIRLWVYGHYHKFDAHSLNRSPFHQKPLWQVQLPTLRIGYANRGFCMLELRRKAGKVIDANVYQYVLDQGLFDKRPGRRVFCKG